MAPQHLSAKTVDQFAGWEQILNKVNTSTGIQSALRYSAFVDPNG